MRRWQTVLWRLVRLPIWLTVLLAVSATAALTCAFLFFGSNHPLSYAAYALSAYALTVLCFRAPAIVRGIRAFWKSNRFLVRLTHDRRFRVKTGLYLSLAYGTAYAALQFGMGLFHGSAWFFSLAAYHILLVVMRFFLLRDVQVGVTERGLRREYLRYRFCGAVLLLMNMALAGIVVFMTRFGRGFTHHPITTIALAAYTFTAMTVAIVEVVRYRRQSSPLLSAAKIISLAAACVSMLTLESAMLSAFGGTESAEFQHIMLLITGAAVCSFVFALAVYMLVHSTKQLKTLRRK